MAATVGTTAFPSPSTINVVPGNLKWSREAAQKAADKGAFIRVGGQGAQVTKRFLSGAQRAWNSNDPNDQNSIYNVEYRITGTPESVAAALRLAGYDENAITQIVNNSINRYNVGDAKRDEFLQEIERASALRQSQKASATAGYTWLQLTWFAQNIKSAVVQTKSGTTTGGAKSPAKGNKNNLKARYDKLKDGEYLDVSNLVVHSGTGAQVKKVLPKPTSGKFKGGPSSELKIISNDADKAVAAVRLIFGDSGVTHFANDLANIQYQIEQFKASTKPAAAPSGAFPVTGVPTLPGAMLAPQPVIAPTQSQVPQVPGANLAAPPVLGNVPGVPSVLSPTGGAVRTIGANAGNVQPMASFSQMMN